MSWSSQMDQNWYAYQAPVEARVAFIRRTYLHLAAAMIVFVLLSYAFYQTGLGIELARFSFGTRGGWLLILGGFTLLGWLATALADGDRPIGTQYMGLGLYVVAEAVIFSPLLTLASLYAPAVLPNAAAITLVTFAGLSLFVLTTRQDFSFLRTGLIIGSLVSLGLIVFGVLFGWQLGVWFSAAMILLACGAILYTTSRVLHDYRTDQYVAASIQLFAAVALLLWYVIRILLQMQRR